MKLEILPAAWTDLADGFRFYEKQSPGAGSRFRELLIADIDSLRTTAGFHRKIFGSHRLLATRLPFAVYYSIREHPVTIRAVLDCRRDPNWSREKLR